MEITDDSVTDENVSIIIGEMLTNPKYEKYKYIPEGLLGDIIRDFVMECKGK